MNLLNKKSLFSFLIFTLSFYSTTAEAETKESQNKYIENEKVLEQLESLLQQNVLEKSSLAILPKCPSGGTQKRCCVDGNTSLASEVEILESDYKYHNLTKILYPQNGKNYIPIYSPQKNSSNIQTNFIEGIMRRHSYEDLQGVAFFNKIIEESPESPLAYLGKFWLLRNSSTDLEENIDTFNFMTSTVKKLPDSFEFKEREELWVEWSSLWQYASLLYNLDPKKFKYPSSSRFSKYIKETFQNLESKFPNDVDAQLFHSEFLSNWGESYSATTHNPRQTILNKLEGLIPKSPIRSHYLIHAYEGRNPSPVLLKTAKSIEKYGSGSAHLTHMAGHIHYDFGKYLRARESFLKAKIIDEEYARQHKVTPFKLWNWAHNMDFLIVNNSETGLFSESEELLNELEEKIPQLAPFQDQEKYVNKELSSWTVRVKFYLRTQQWLKAKESIQKIIRMLRENLKPYQSIVVYANSELNLLYYQSYTDALLAWEEKDIQKIKAAIERMSFVKKLIWGIYYKFNNSTDSQKEASHLTKKYIESIEEHLLTNKNLDLVELVKKSRKERKSKSAPSQASESILEYMEDGIPNTGYTGIAHSIALGFQHILEKKYSMAKISFEKALRIQKGRPIEITRQFLGPVEELYAEALSSIQEHEKAYALFHGQELFWPQSARADLGRARVYRTQKDSSRAKYFYKSFLKKWKEADTDNPWIVESRDYLGN